MARSLERPGAGLACLFPALFSLLPLSTALAQADKSERVPVDLDGDGRVSDIEEIAFQVWLEYLPDLAKEALAAGIPKDNGTLDI
ncbi:MAG: hypothetical protein JXP34_01550, partial [Planctomycetes bacterium]|nr:hypothetical protein [Planctomycetota bacterium]